MKMSNNNVNITVTDRTIVSMVTGPYPTHSKEQKVYDKMFERELKEYRTLGHTVYCNKRHLTKSQILHLLNKENRCIKGTITDFTVIPSSYVPNKYEEYEDSTPKKKKNKK